MAQIPQDEVKLGPGDIAARVAVIVLGVLIVMMIALIAYTIVGKKGTSSSPAAAQDSPVLTLDVGSGARLVDKQLVGQTLMLEIETAGGREIVLLDARSGELIRHVRLRSP